MVFSGVRSRVVDLVATGHDDDHEPDEGEDQQPYRPGGSDPVEVRAVVRRGIEGTVEPEHGRRHGNCNDQVLPPFVPTLGDEPKRRHGEDEIDELDRERTDRGRENERRELIIGEERHELASVDEAELGGVARDADEHDEADAADGNHQIADPRRVVARGLREEGREQPVAAQREEAAADHDADRERERHGVEDHDELENGREPRADVERRQLADGPR